MLSYISGHNTERFPYTLVLLQISKLCKTALFFWGVTSPVFSTLTLETIMKQLKMLLFLVIFSIPALAFADLTGRWSCNDGGTYYIRQIGRDVYWFGELSPTSPTWSNVAVGQIIGNQINLRWADVPKGTIMQSGNLILRLETPNRAAATYKTGGFGGSVWTRP